MTLVKTPQEFKAFSGMLKDELVKVYNFIVRHQEELENVDFTPQGIMMAHNLTSIVSCSEKWANIFLANLEQIKSLSDNQPTTLVEVTRHIPKHMGSFYMTDNVVNDCYVSVQTESFRTYQLDKHETKLRLIEHSKFFHSYRISQDGVDVINNHGI